MTPQFRNTLLDFRVWMPERKAVDVWSELADALSDSGGQTGGADSRERAHHDRVIQVGIYERQQVALAATVAQVGRQPLLAAGGMRRRLRPHPRQCLSRESQPD